MTAIGALPGLYLPQTPLGALRRNPCPARISGARSRWPIGESPSKATEEEQTGDLLVMRGRTPVTEWTPGESRHLHVGKHGGSSEEDMLIHLIVEKT